MIVAGESSSGTGGDAGRARSRLSFPPGATD